jgi:hypothetical protein
MDLVTGGGEVYRGQSHAASAAAPLVRLSRDSACRIQGAREVGVAVGMTAGDAATAGRNAVHAHTAGRVLDLHEAMVDITDLGHVHKTTALHRPLFRKTTIPRAAMVNTKASLTQPLHFHQFLQTCPSHSLLPLHHRLPTGRVHGHLRRRHLPRWPVGGYRPSDTLPRYREAPGRRRGLFRRAFCRRRHQAYHSIASSPKIKAHTSLPVGMVAVGIIEADVAAGGGAEEVVVRGNLNLWVQYVSCHKMIGPPTGSKVWMEMYYPAKKENDRKRRCSLLTYARERCIMTNKQHSEKAFRLFL